MSRARLIVQPDAGFAPVLDAFGAARRTIDVAVFRLRMMEIVEALEAAVARGVRVRALVAHRAGGEGERLREAEQRLLDSGAIVARTADDLARYHGKYLLADDALYVMGFNFTRKTLRTRSLGVVTTDARAVRDARAVFECDMARSPVALGPRSPIVVSPDTSRTALERFIAGATRSLAIYDKRLREPGFVALIEACAARGVAVRVLGRAPALASTVPVRPLADVKLHVRAMVRDGEALFVGSQGLDPAELDRRRELGLIVDDRALASAALQVFDDDWVRSERDDDPDREDALDYAPVG